MSVSCSVQELLLTKTISKTSKTMEMKLNTGQKTQKSIIKFYVARCVPIRHCWFTELTDCQMKPNSRKILSCRKQFVQNWKVSAATSSIRWGVELCPTGAWLFLGMEIFRFLVAFELKNRAPFTETWNETRLWVIRSLRHYFKYIFVLN